jgi:hypothetical protein
MSALARSLRLSSEAHGRSFCVLKMVDERRLMVFMVVLANSATMVFWVVSDQCGHSILLIKGVKSVHRFGLGYSLRRILVSQRLDTAVKKGD